MRRVAPNNLAIAAAIIIVALLGASYWVELSSPERKKQPKPTPAQKTTTAASATNVPAVKELELIAALRNKQLAATFSGNGRESLVVALRNLTDAPVQTTFLPGQIFTTADSAAQIVCTQTTTLTVPAMQADRSRIPSAAIRLSNTLGNYVFLPAETRLPSLEPLWPALARFPNATPATIQTAILLMLEDPPLAHFAKFALSASETLQPPPPDTFKVETQDIILALGILAKATPEKYFKLLDSAQLRLEALINPRSHDAAIVFYNINPDHQFDFWRTELAHGDPSTRHYALYGIARYYPDVAYEMLPKWILETRTPGIYRQHAAYALAEIPSTEALKALTQLRAQLSGDQSIAPALEIAISRWQKMQSPR